MTSIETKFGTAKLQKDGYMAITSYTEGNNHKRLHTLVWEDFYGKPVPNGYVIHHLNGIKTDNRIQNLQCCEKYNHLSLHNKGKNHHRAKYTLWDSSYVNYINGNMYRNGREPNPCRCFRLRHKGKHINIGVFSEWTSIDIINDFIKEEVN